MSHLGEEWLAGVACPSERFCIATEDHGDVLTSTDPAGGAGDWEAHEELAGSVISCPSVSLCVTGGGSPEAFIVTGDFMKPQVEHGVYAQNTSKN